MNDLRIPVALASDGRAVHANEGARFTDLSCPACCERVVWKNYERSQRARNHFAHRADSTCGGESAIHRGAKLMVAQLFEDHAKGRARRPLLVHNCVECCASAEPIAGPTGITRVTVEERLEYGLVPDVLLYLESGQRIALEICYRHPVDAQKAETLEQEDIEWIELVAEAALEDPPVLRVVRRSQKVTAVCAICQAALLRHAGAALKEREALKAQKKALDLESEKLRAEAERLRRILEGERLAEARASLERVQKQENEARESLAEVLDEIEERRAALSAPQVEDERLAAEIVTRRQQLSYIERSVSDYVKCTTIELREALEVIRERRCA